jgi:amino acid permease
MSYLDISVIDQSFDPLFASPDDSVFNPNQARFYNEMNNSLKTFSKPINEDLKQIQVNTYYYKRYKSENQILYFTIVILFIIIVLSLIRKKFPYLDETTYSIIVGIILAFSLMYIMYCIWKLLYKDKLNYDENDYGHMSLDDTSAGSTGECNRSTLTTSDISYNVSNLKNFLKM